MPTAGERRALLFLASVATLGAGWRAVRGDDAMRPTDSERAALETQIAAVDSARTAASARHPAGPGGRAGSAGRGRGRTPRGGRSALPPSQELIDVDLATAADLERLPRIGPALANRIVANRDSFGAFGSLDALQRVSGIGPAMARQLGAHVTFSTLPRSPPRSPGGSAAPFPGQIVWRHRNTRPSPSNPRPPTLPPRAPTPDPRPSTPE